MLKRISVDLSTGCVGLIVNYNFERPEPRTAWRPGSYGELRLEKAWIATDPDEVNILPQLPEADVAEVEREIREWLDERSDL